MAAAPEEGPELFVCLDCRVTHAGSPVSETPPYDEYDPPDECGGCGGTTFARMDEYLEAV